MNPIFKINGLKQEDEAGKNDEIKRNNGEKSCRKTITVVNFIKGIQGE